MGEGAELCHDRVVWQCSRLLDGGPSQGSQSGMDTSFTNSVEEVAVARRDETDWASYSRKHQIRSIELEGYVVLPKLLSESQLESIREELRDLPTKSVDYSPHQRGYSNVQWSNSPRSIELIAHKPMIDFLTDLFGDEMICACRAVHGFRTGTSWDSDSYGCPTLWIQNLWVASELPRIGESAIIWTIKLPSVRHSR